MELYLDTANVAEVERLARIFPISSGPHLPYCGRYHQPEHHCRQP